MSERYEVVRTGNRTRDYAIFENDGSPDGELVAASMTGAEAHRVAQLLNANLRRGQRVRINEGVHDAGRCGTIVGPVVEVSRTTWVPVLWDGEEDPDFFKARFLTELAVPQTEDGHAQR